MLAPATLRRPCVSAIAATGLLCLVLESGVVAQDLSGQRLDAQKDSPSKKQNANASESELLLGPVPKIEIDTTRFLVTAEEADKIKTLINQLAKIDSPDYGFAPWMSGTQFAPVDTTRNFNAGIIMVEHGLKTQPGFKQLVALGPRALPQLLARLTDETPTKLVMEHKGFGGIQWYAKEIPTNPANLTEQTIREQNPEVFGPEARNGVGKGSREHIARHPITIGDVCFVAVGQIVNRNYQSARYQPTGCRVLNSPTHDPKIAEIVRGVWKSDAPAQSLLDSLMTDLHTAGRSGYLLQKGAVTRLLYYFPDESSKLIADRIESFASVENDASDRLNGGISGRGIIEAAAPFTQPVIVDALFQVVQHTKDIDYLDAAITDAVVNRDPELVYNRMKAIVSEAPPQNQGPFGKRYHILNAAATRFPKRSQELFDIYRRHGTIDTLRATIHALKEPHDAQPWMKTYLASLLGDKRDTGWEYGPDHDRQPIRICDEAADVLARYYMPDFVRFEYEENPAYLDKQIVKLRRVLDGEKNVSFGPPGDILPTDLPSRKPVRLIDVPPEWVGRLYEVYPFSDETNIWARIGFRGRGGWAADTLKLDAKSGEVVDRVPLDQWAGAVSIIDGGPADRAFCYHGNEGGHILIRDIRTGRLIKRLETPFRSDVNWDNGDLTSCGAMHQWIIAFTPDGALHSFDLETGKHRIEWKYQGEILDPHVITPLRGTAKVLIEDLGDPFDEEKPLYIWDQITRRMNTLGKVPIAPWQGGWGNIAWNDFNGIVTLWNLDKVHEIRLPRTEIPFVSIVCNSDQTTAFLQNAEGTVYACRIIDGMNIKPIRRLVTPDARDMEVTLVLSKDDRLLFWHGYPPRLPQSDEGEKEKEKRAVIAIFKVADLTK